MFNSSQRLNLERILADLQPGGLLSRSLKGFEARISQQEMLSEIVKAYNEGGIALIEAGTGTGKSLAYLLPAMLWAALFQERTIVSTNTITLQEQLLHKDIPLIAKAFNLDLKVVLVKGMNNYLCLRKLEDLRHELRLLSPEENQQLEQIEQWAVNTQDGSRSDLPFVPLHSVWERVSAEQDACSNKECPHYKECHFFKARRNAADANLLVGNHHLLFADLAFKAEEKQKQGLIPNYSKVILDEAHHIEEVATEFFAVKVSRSALLRNLSRLFGDKLGKLALLKQRLESHYKKSHPKELYPIFSRLNIDLPALRRTILEQIDTAFQSFEQLAGNPYDQEVKLRIMPQHVQHPIWRDQIVPQSNHLAQLLKELAFSLQTLETDTSALKDEKLEEALKSLKIDLGAIKERIADTAIALEQFINKASASHVRWVEVQFKRGLSNIVLVQAELDIAPYLAKWLFNKHSTVALCSATLATNKQFSYIKKRLGIDERFLESPKVREKIYDSPFNYQQQALFVIPTDLPVPNHPEFIQQASEKILEAIRASRGNAFVLFTSHQMLRECYQQLVERLTSERYVVMKQGDVNRKTLLENFRTTDRSVLFGTDSFWEGVDVVGDALRCVIIVKLPFKVPTEPIIQARAEAIENNGGDSFFEYLLPNAVVKFKQGFGRLIRNSRDRGCIVCLDSRLLQKGYGKYFLNSLPSCNQLFAEGKSVQEKMADFYRKTHHLTK